jgi:hypothetical protein
VAGGPKSSRMELAVMALLNSPDIQTAAKESGVGETTLWRWMREDAEFQDMYRIAKAQALTMAIGRLQQSTCEAVEVLRSVAVDPDSPASSRVSVAKTILELALKAKETEEFEERLKKLEELALGAGA